MELSGRQKKYIKKRYRSESVSSLARSLSVSEDVVVAYLQKNGEKIVVSNEESESVPPFLKDTRIVGLLLFALIFIIYGTILGNEFASDSKSIANIQYTDLQKLFTERNNYLSVVWLLRMDVTALVIGKTPFVFSAFAILNHTITAVVFFAVVRKISNAKTALLSSVLFAAHPFVTEPVTWQTANGYVQYTFLFLISLFLFIRHSDKKKWWFLSVIFFALSLFSSEKAISLFGILFIYVVFFSPTRKMFLKLIPYASLIVFNLFVIYTAISMRTQALTQIYGHAKSIPLTTSVPAALSEYLRLLVWPSDLTLYHSDMYFSKMEFAVRVGVLGIIATMLCYLLYRMLSRKERTGTWGSESVVPLKNQSTERYVLFWAGFFVIALLPTLFSFGLGWIVAERYAYASSLGFFAIVGYFFAGAHDNKRYAPYVLLVFTLIVIGLSVRTVFRNLDWRNEDTLWLATAKTSPMSSNNHNNLGDYYSRRKDYDRAIKEFKIALQIQPSYAHAHHNLGNTYRVVAEAYLAQKKNDEATKLLNASVSEFAEALKINPMLWESHFQGAISYYLLGQKDKAIEELDKAIQINPQNRDMPILRAKMLAP